MSMAAAAQAELSRLRQHIARIEGRLAEAERLPLEALSALRKAPGEEAIDPVLAGSRRPRRRLALGIAALDERIGGGLPLGALHEIRADESRDGVAAGGFVLALAARAIETGKTRALLWISAAESRRETGRLYAPGLAALGLDPDRVVEVAAAREGDALWAFEAALSCHGMGLAICELRRPSLDLSATRRCALKAREAGVTGLLLRIGGAAEPSAAELRLRVSPMLAGIAGGFAEGIGRAAWRLTLEKNRGGRTGRFLVEWNADERCFAEPARRGRARPQPVPAPPADRPAAEGGAGKDRIRRAS